MFNKFISLSQRTWLKHEHNEIHAQKFIAKKVNLQNFSFVRLMCLAVSRAIFMNWALCLCIFYRRGNLYIGSPTLFFKK